MKTEILSSADAASQRGAEIIADEAHAAVAKRGRFVLALSGGRGPWQMLRTLAGMELPWKDIFVVQVDERVAPDGDPTRNLTHIRESLLNLAPLPADQLFAMPVTAPDLAAAASEYAATLAKVAGSPPVIDLVHLGIGPDGHTASLVPGDPALDVSDRDVTISGPYQGRKRMTLTYPVLNRARAILWLVTAADKVDALARMRQSDPSIPAGRVEQARAMIVADFAAAGPTARS